MDDTKGSNSKKKCCDCKFFKLFILQLFDIGKSTGSLVGEIINVFRIFQRSTASESFSLSFSKDYLKIMKWATNLVQIIASDFISTKKLTTYELFLMYSCIIPITLLFFLCSLVLGPWIAYYLIPYLFFLLFGVGLGFIGINKIAAISCLIIGAFFIISIFLSMKKQIFRIGCFKASKEKRMKMIINRFKSGGFQFTLAMLPTVFIFVIHIIFAFLFNNEKFAQTCVIIAYAILIIVFLLELFTKNLCCCKKKMLLQYEKINIKMMILLVNFFSIIIIPATENFAELIKDDYKKQWRIIVGYIALAALFPLIMIFMLIRGNFPDICEKYKRSKCNSFNWYPYIELLDFAKQIAFAIASAYDINYGCIGIEVAWIVFIISLRPINGISSYSLLLGESLVMIVTNSVAIYQKSHIDHTFNFAVTVFFVALCCLPAIASLYLYFIFDFNTGVDSKDDENKYDSESIVKAISITYWLIPFGLIFLGMFYPIFIHAE